MDLKQIFADDPEVLRALEERDNLGMMKELYKESLRTQQLNEAKQDAEIVNIKFLKGEKGDQGEQGIQGIQGGIGPKGEPGIDGGDGVDGKDGKPGRNGKDGKDGKDGEAALAVNQEKLVTTIIEKIRKDKALDVSDIRNFQSFVYKGTKYGVSELMHGGSSSSGATTLVVETPVGAVDDSNTTFTVTHTPLYIVVNGSQYTVGTGTFTSYAAGTITLSSAVGVGGFIRSYYNS